ncbi:hypothetical protein MP228_013055 [Amoeboaphelidium protococcarum]|nr:hypothetical protein MP228_013055 [Amoeboaphelidium protococcarum]
MMHVLLFLVSFASIAHCAVAVSEQTRTFADTLVDLLNVVRPETRSVFCLNQKLMEAAQELADIEASGQSYDHTDGRNLYFPSQANGFNGTTHIVQILKNIKTPQQAFDQVKEAISRGTRYNYDQRFIGVGYNDGHCVVYFVASEHEQCMPSVKAGTEVQPTSTTAELAVSSQLKN